jgi:NAD(P)-dependent dehydrogenase (short-subunit alcohol dehydrogenase family)
MEKFILITGVSSGIGQGLASHYIQKGFNVIGTVRTDKDADALKNDRFHKIIFDVKDKAVEENLQKKVKAIIGNYSLFGLINNAGIVKAGPLEFVTEEDFSEQIEVNVIAVRRVTNAMLPLMESGSRIVMISSVSGLFNTPYTGAYCISKHAVESMCDIYRRELNSFGIKVVAIEPGPIKSKIWGKSKGTFDQFKNTRYDAIAPDADKMIETAEGSALDVSYVAEACDKALLENKPKARYIVHKNKLAFKLFAQFIPDSIADYLVARTLRGGKKHRMI